MNPNFMSKLGPLTPLVGEWEGNEGVDVSYHNTDDEIADTTYFETAYFKPIPIVENGQQVMWGLNYGMTAWRHGEEAMDPFHDEVGYLLWEKSTGQVLRCFAVPRGLAILAGGDATPDSTELTFASDPKSPTYGLVQNKYLLERAEATAFTSTFTIHGDGDFSYTSDLTLRLVATGKTMHHTDRGRLRRVKKIGANAG